MGFFSNKKSKKSYWLKWADGQMKQGLSRWDVAMQLLQSSHASADELRARLDAQSDLSNVFLQRNQDGMDLEKQGQIEEAIVLYQTNIAEGFTGQHPYERLRILYTKQKNYDKAIEICKAYLALPDIAPKKRVKFSRDLEKLKAKQ